MNSAIVNRWMRNQSLLNEETLPLLRDLVEQYPLCAVPKMLYLVNLARLHHPHYEKELRRLAVSLPDRKRLYGLIHGERLGWKMENPSATLLTAPEMTDSFSLIDQFLSDTSMETGSTSTPDLLFQPAAAVDYLATMQSEPAPESVSELPEEPAEQTQAVSEAPVPQPEESAPMLHQDLIDSFLDQEAMRQNRSSLATEVEQPVPEEPAEPFNPPAEVAENSLKSLDDSFFTETLAHIYTKQKRYEKALQIIQNLSLKYPEKNIYFADQIRFLERLIINTKK